MSLSENAIEGQCQRATVSTDGVLQASGGSSEDPTKGFKFGGWVMRYLGLVFADGSAPHSFNLARSRVAPTGVIVGHYEREGEI